MRNMGLAVLAALFMSVPSGAWACAYPPPPPPIPGETEAEWRLRAVAELQSRMRDSATETEANYLREARSVYFARLVRSEEIRVDGQALGRKATFRPVKIIKGPMPTNTIKLRDRELTSCGLSGDGPATAAGVGRIAIVFDGVDNDGMSYHSRIYAILANDTQQPDLVAAWKKWKAEAQVADDEQQGIVR